MLKKTTININNHQYTHYTDESYNFTVTVIGDKMFIRNDDFSEAVILSKEEIIKILQKTHHDIVCYKKLSNGLFPI